MPKITNQSGDFIEVQCGGFGGDNVFGKVYQEGGETGTPVADAAVNASNMSNNQFYQKATTDSSGAFDVDVDAACGDHILVYATWTDASGASHVVHGSFRCPPCEKGQEKRHAAAGPKERLKHIDQMEGRVLELIAAQLGQQSLIAALQSEIADRVIADLNALGELDSEAQKIAIDERLRKEIVSLLYKRALVRQNPTPEQMWAIIDEMILILLKLTAKVFRLQDQPPPEFPRPGWGGDAT